MEGLSLLLWQPSHVSATRLPQAPGFFPQNKHVSHSYPEVSRNKPFAAPRRRLSGASRLKEKPEMSHIRLIQNTIQHAWVLAARAARARHCPEEWKETSSSTCSQVTLTILTLSQVLGSSISIDANSLFERLKTARCLPNMQLFM